MNTLEFAKKNYDANRDLECRSDSRSEYWWSIHQRWISP